MHARPPAFRRRQVQQVGQHQVQVPPSGANLLQHAEKILRQPAALAQADHRLRQPHQRAQRRADLVAHVRQEQSLGAVGPLGRFLGLLQLGLARPQRFLDSPQVGHVRKRAPQPRRRTGHEFAARDRMAPFPVRPAEIDGHGIGFAGRPATVHGRLQAGGGFGREELHLRRGRWRRPPRIQTVDPQELRRTFHDVRGRIPLPAAHVGDALGFGEFQLPRAHFRLRALARRQVHEGGQQQVVHGGDAGEDVARRAVLAGDPHLAAGQLPPARIRRHGIPPVPRLRAISRIRIGPFEPVVQRPDFGRAIAKQLREPIVDEDLPRT